MMRALRITAATAAIALFAALSGCGGGSESTPTITARPKRVETASGNGSKTVAATNGKNGKAEPKGGSGSLSGRIVYDGPAPTPAKPAAFNPTDPKTDPFCVGIKEKIVEDSLIVGKNGGVQNVLIFIRNKPSGYSASVPKTAKEFTNRFCMFSPRVLAVQVKQTLKILNEDKASHNTHLFPDNPLNPEFKPLIPQGQTTTYIYQAQENSPVKVTCDIHPWMLAYQLPLDHDLFAVTDKDGNFEIKNIPAGTHEFVIWHERPKYLERRLRVTIEPGKPTKIEKKYGATKFVAVDDPSQKTIVLSLSK